MGWVRCAYQTRLARLLDCFFRHFRFFGLAATDCKEKLELSFPLQFTAAVENGAPKLPVPQPMFYQM